MAEMRFDPIRRVWSAVSSERCGKRGVFVANNASSQMADENCPFCKMDNGKVLPPIYKINDKLDPNKTALLVTPNRYPVMGVEGELKRGNNGLYEWTSGIGAHEIIIDSPRHNLSPGDYTQDELFNLFKAIRVRIEDLNKDIRFKYLAAFKNIGFGAGEVINHPHAQIMAAPVVPVAIENIVANADKYYKEKERCIFCDVVAFERKDKVRIVVENYEFAAFCPYASENPFQVAVYPKKHSAFYCSTSDNSLNQLADIVKEVLTRYCHALNSPSVSLALRLAPLRDFRKNLKGWFEFLEESYHWYLDIRPVMTVNSGNFWGSEIAVNPVKPEEAAQYLKEVKSV